MVWCVCIVYVVWYECFMCIYGVRIVCGIVYMYLHVFVHGMAENKLKRSVGFILTSGQTLFLSEALSATVCSRSHDPGMQVQLLSCFCLQS